MASTVRISTKKFKSRDVWRDCLDDPRFLQKHKITDEDRQILEDFSPLGGVTGETDVLFILDTIRWARGKK